MKISKICKSMVMLTSLSLIYIHMQMQIFDSAYQAKKREQFIKRLSEENGNLTYNILKLKSSHNLGNKLLSEKSDMKFMDHTQIVRLESPQPARVNTVVITAVEKKTNPILSFLSLKSQAEAKPQD